MKVKFATIGANEDGTKIFCKMAIDKRNVLRGFYDFNLEKFIIIKYFYTKFPKGMSKKMVKKELKNELLNYDWEL